MAIEKGRRVLWEDEAAEVVEVLPGRAGGTLVRIRLADDKTLLVRAKDLREAPATPVPAPGV